MNNYYTQSQLTKLKKSDLIQIILDNQFQIPQPTKETSQPITDLQQHAWPFPVETKPPQPRSVLLDDQAAMNIRPPQDTPQADTEPFAPEPVAALDQSTQPVIDTAEPVDENEITGRRNKAAQAAWKKDNPEDTLKNQRNMYEQGKIDHLPWETQEYELVE